MDRRDIIVAHARLLNRNFKSTPTPKNWGSVRHLGSVGVCVGLKTRVVREKKGVTEFNDQPEGDGVSPSLKHTAHNHSNNKTQTANYPNKKGCRAQVDG